MQADKKIIYIKVDVVWAQYFIDFSSRWNSCKLGNGSISSKVHSELDPITSNLVLDINQQTRKPPNE